MSIPANNTEQDRDVLEKTELYDTIRVVDLFCGAGGLSWAIVEALKEVAIQVDAPTKPFLAEIIELVGINHWEQAIETHAANNPWARHFHDDIENVDPEEVFEEDDPDVTLVSGGIECKHWSTARGGQPVKEQKRMPAKDFLEYVSVLEPEYVLVENVPEFEDWGPIEDGEPTRDGTKFDEWVDELHGEGYSVDWNVLNAADYGEATSRKRLFVLATRDGSPSFPEPTHSEDGRGELEEWRSAAEIIDWSDPGGSIWTRDLTNNRIHSPPKNSTMKRIAEGIRRHCHDCLSPFAEALEQMGNGKEDDPVEYKIQDLRSRVVPVQYAETAADTLQDPFLVRFDKRAANPSPALSTPYVLSQFSNGAPRDVTDRPMPTITAGSRGISLLSPGAYLLRQQSGGVPADADDPVPTISTRGAVQKVETRPLVMPRNGPQRGLHSNPLYKPEERPLHTVTAKNTDGHLVTPSLIRYSHGGKTLSVEDPMPTIATERGGVFALSSPYLCPLYNERTGQRPRTRSVSRPLMTIPASKSPAALSRPIVRPFIDDYEGPPADVEEPLGTITSRDRFALCIPELYPWGLDLRYRMLQPRELKQAQGFPGDYEILGTKTDTTEQIGNAVPVNLAQSLVESLLGDRMPSLTDFVDDDSATVDPPTDPTPTRGGATSDD